MRPETPALARSRSEPASRPCASAVSSGLGPLGLCAHPSGPRGPLGHGFMLSFSSSFQSAFQKVPRLRLLSTSLCSVSVYAACVLGLSVFVSTAVPRPRRLLVPVSLPCAERRARGLGGSQATALLLVRWALHDPAFFPVSVLCGQTSFISRVPVPVPGDWWTLRPQAAGGRLAGPAGPEPPCPSPPAASPGADAPAARREVAAPPASPLTSPWSPPASLTRAALWALVLLTATSPATSP